MTTLPDILSDVIISKGSVPRELDGISARGVLWQVADGRFLLDVHGTARYLVEDGRTIIVDPDLGASVDSVEYFLKLLPLAALAYQRGLLALHAAAVYNDDGVLLLAGDSGSGKSTLLAGLLSRGWRMLADDLTIVGLDEKSVPIVYPTQAYAALWPVALKRLGIVADTLPQCDANRRAYSPAGLAECLPLRLTGICHLKVHNKPEAVMDKVTTFARFQSVGSMLYNSRVADVMCDRGAFLRCASVVASSVAFRELHRPRGVWSLDALVDMITYQ